MFRLTNYIVLPFAISVCISYIVYNFSSDGVLPFLFLLVLIAVAFVLDRLFIKCQIQRREVNIFLRLKRFDGGVLSAFSLFLVCFCLLDLYVNGLKILHPEEYADLSSDGSSVRHISNMCWVFVVASFVEKRKQLSFFWLLSGFVFPVLFVDRNRLLQSIFCYVVIKFHLTPRENRLDLVRRLSILIILVVFLFLVLGIYRSGESAFVIESSGDYMLYGYFPLADFFGDLNPAIQQLLLYIVSPIFNFVTLFNLGYMDSSILAKQTIPFIYLSGDIQDLPFLVPRFNVSTEFGSFLLFGGPLAVFCAHFVEISICGFLVYFYKKTKNVFVLMVVLKFLYCAFMMGFAPQFYTYTNYGFVVVCGFLFFISSVLKSSLRN